MVEALSEEMVSDEVVVEEETKMIVEEMKEGTIGGTVEETVEMIEEIEMVVEETVEMIKEIEMNLLAAEVDHTAIMIRDRRIDLDVMQTDQKVDLIQNQPQVEEVTDPKMNNRRKVPLNQTVLRGQGTEPQGEGLLEAVVERTDEEIVDLEGGVIRATGGLWIDQGMGGGKGRAISQAGCIDLSWVKMCYGFACSLILDYNTM